MARFLRLVDDATPAHKQLHLIVDNYATHKHPAVQRWLKRHPRFHMHFTPTSASWLNMVGRFFRDLTANRLRRWCLSRRHRTRARHRRLRRSSQRESETLHLDGLRKRHPRKSEARPPHTG